MSFRRKLIGICIALIALLAIVMAAVAPMGTDARVGAPTVQDSAEMNVVLCSLADGAVPAYCFDGQDVGRGDMGVAAVRKLIGESRRSVVLVLSDPLLGKMPTARAELENAANGRRILYAPLPRGDVVNVLFVREPRGRIILELNGRILSETEAIDKFEETARRGGVLIEVDELPRDAGPPPQGRARWEYRLTNLRRTNKLRYEHVSF